MHDSRTQRDQKIIKTMIISLTKTSPQTKREIALKKTTMMNEGGPTSRG